MLLSQRCIPTMTLVYRLVPSRAGIHTAKVQLVVRPQSVISHLAANDSLGYLEDFAAPRRITMNYFRIWICRAIPSNRELVGNKEGEGEGRYAVLPIPSVPSCQPEQSVVHGG